MSGRLPGGVWLRVVCAVLLCCVAGGCNRHLGEWDTEAAARQVEVHEMRDSDERDPPPSAWRDSDAADATNATPPVTPPQAPVIGGLQRCEPVRGDESCGLPNGVQLVDDVAIASADAIYYFAAGAVLPAGHYRLSYVDGCQTFFFGVESFFGLETFVGWNVHSLPAPGDPVTGLGGCWLVGDDARVITLGPGSGGLDAENGAYPTYEACVQANCSAPAVELDFEGGVLGMRYGSVGLPYLTGASHGGRGPTFRLTRTGPCP